MWRCPECGSSRLEQFRMPYGAMWCQDCGFRVEDKTAVPNPFYVPEEEPADPPQADEDRPGLGEQLYTWQQQMKRKKKK